MGDFSACWGQAIMHHNNKPIGMVLEVEYHPVQDIETGNYVLNHFLDLIHSATASLGGRFIPIDPHFSEYHLGPEYTNQHNTLQYIHLTAVLLQSRNIRAAGIPMGTSGTPGAVVPGDSVSSTPVGTPAVGT
ncbi:hypothetical protein CYMTET_30768 [Cymbomonas tetramitiformis]|uniref:Mediator complex subunit 20 n=1 Tax=Cymbomonas tetramitiformis TaxID=36881 RepID=A0AAE0FI99_9CHLO|nr:hypothetical protein CYMTET_30768 [Cymbomonas tetramitiformis]